MLSPRAAAEIHERMHRHTDLLFPRKEATMRVLTKKVSEEVLIDKPTRLVVLEAAANKVKFGIKGGGSGERGRETAAHPNGRAGKTVKIIAPYGEEIEIDC
jgi:hypothetical protein